MDPHNAPVICSHFGECGGCASQDVAYADEVRDKEAALRKLLSRDVPVRPSPVEFHYRTRMDFVYGWGKLGQRKKGDPMGVLDLDECLLVTPRAWEAMLKVKEAIARLDIRSYSYVAKKGYLRYVSVREAPVNGELMLVFLTNGFDPAIRPLLDEAEAWAESVVWSVSERRADVSVGEVVEHRGRDWIEEKIGDVSCRFGPNSFFQVNPWQTDAMYRHVAEQAAGEILDLYCGVGGIGLVVAKRAGSVRGIDNNAEAIRFAKGNAERNGVDAEFMAADAGKFVAERRFDTIIVDPPRSGLGFKMLKKLLVAAPKRIVYVCCNPNKLAAELPHFDGYEVTDLRAFDLFPKTPHVEVVATFTSVSA